MNILTTEMFDLTKSIAAPLLKNCNYSWEALPKIKDFILKIGPQLSANDYENIGNDIWIGKNVNIHESAVICGPAIIGADTEIRPSAFIRGSAIIGCGCVIGNSCEIKNSIIFDKVQIPHFNYIGDSILGFSSHTGAGAITSNVKSDRTLVTVTNGTEKIATGLKKFGAIIGDYVEIGCNCVLNPGTIIGRNTNVYPLSSVRGTIPPNSIYKSQNNIVEKIEIH